MTSWRCLQCDEGESGDNWTAIDRAAERHTKTAGHATTTSTVGSTRSRDEAGRVRNVKAGGG